MFNELYNIRNKLVRKHNKFQSCFLMFYHVLVTCGAKNIKLYKHQRKTFDLLRKTKYWPRENKVYYMWLTACFSSSLYFHTPFPFSTFSLYLFLYVCLVHVQIGAYNISEYHSFSRFYFIILRTSAQDISFVLKMCTRTGYEHWA